MVKRVLVRKLLWLLLLWWWLTGEEVVLVMMVGGERCWGRNGGEGLIKGRGGGR